jgi:hypothetical protein
MSDQATSSPRGMTSETEPEPRGALGQRRGPGRPRTVPDAICQRKECGKTFRVTPGNPNKFCSPKCSNAAMATHTPADVARMRELWDEGLSASAIGRSFSPPFSKNVIIGIAHRRHFPPRKSKQPRPAASTADRRFEAGDHGNGWAMLSAPHSHNGTWRTVQEKRNLFAKAIVRLREIGWRDSKIARHLGVAGTGAVRVISLSGCPPFLDAPRKPAKPMPRAAAPVPPEAIIWQPSHEERIAAGALRQAIEERHPVGAGVFHISPDDWMTYAAGTKHGRVARS